MQCDKCEKQFSRRYLKMHMQIHDEERPVLHCPEYLCPRYFYFYRNLKQHLLSFHLDGKFLCNVRLVHYYLLCTVRLVHYYVLCTIRFVHYYFLCTVRLVHCYFLCTVRFVHLLPVYCLVSTLIVTVYW